MQRNDRYRKYIRLMMFSQGLDFGGESGELNMLSDIRRIRNLLMRAGSQMDWIIYENYNSSVRQHVETAS